jgi:hypothetical protein
MPQHKFNAPKERKKNLEKMFSLTSGTSFRPYLKPERYKMVLDILSEVMAIRPAYSQHQCFTQS